MLSSVDPEMMNSDSQLNWKTVTRGRRSARIKSGEDYPTSSKTEYVPIKKRRLLFQPSSPQPQTPSLCRQDSSSPQRQTSSPPLVGNDQLPCQSFSSIHRSLNMCPSWGLRGIDKLAKVSFGKEFVHESLSEQTEEHNYREDFSGIELLATAASMDADSENADKEDEIRKDSSLPGCSNVSSPVTQSKLGSECRKSESTILDENASDLSLVLSNTSAAFWGLLGSVEDETNPISNSLKVDRRHWDLNTVMDTWDQPYKDSISGDTSKDVTNFDTSVDHALSNSYSIKLESSNLKIEEDMSKVQGPEGSLPEPNNNDYCKVATDISDATEKGVDSPASVEKMGSPIAAEKIESSTSVEKLSLVVGAPQDLEVCLDSHDFMIDGANLTRFKEGSDSPYEDGELRGSCLYSWEDNELDIECVDYESDGRNEAGSDAADLHGSEIVDGGSEGSHGSDRKSLLLKKIPGNSGDSRAIVHSSRRYFVKDVSENNEIAGKKESNEESVIGENEEGNKKILSEQRNEVNEKVASADEYALKTSRFKLQSFTDGKNFHMQKCRSRPLGVSDSHSERDVSRYRPNHASERGGADQWRSWHSRSRQFSTYHGVDDRSNARIRSITGGDTRDKYDRLDFHGKRQAAIYSSKTFYRQSARSRSPVDNEVCFGAYKRVPTTRCDGSYRRVNYSQIAAREFVENFEPLNDDSATIICMPCTSRSERSFSPRTARGDNNTPLARKRSRSRSRIRSPMAWLTRRDRDLFNRKQIRNPGIKLDRGTDEMRAPFLKSTRATDFGDEGYMVTPRGRSSPQHSGRWIDHHRNFEDSHSKRGRSPVRVFRRSQRFEAFTSPSRPRSDEYFRPAIRPRRFSLMDNHDRQYKFETSYEYRKHDERRDRLHRGRHYVGGSKD